MQASVALGNVPSTWTCPLRTLRVDRRRPIGSCLACPRASSGTTSNRTERQGWSAEDSPTSTSGVWSAWSGGDELTQPAHVSFQALDRAGHTVGVLGGQPGQHPATDPARTSTDVGSSSLRAAISIGATRSGANRPDVRCPSRDIGGGPSPSGRQCRPLHFRLWSIQAGPPADTAYQGSPRSGARPEPDRGGVCERCPAVPAVAYGRGTGIARPGGQASRDRSITVALP